jgi:ATP-dependent Lhr-like helicase
MQLVIHAPFGARINRAWGLALRKRFCRSFNFELQAAATDNGIVISLGEQHSFPLEIVFEFLRPGTVEEVLTQAMLPAPMFIARWRWNASRFLTIPRYVGGRKLPPPIMRMRADDLMAAVFPDQAACPENLTGEVRIPDHPLIRETVDNCLHEAMDLESLKSLLETILDGRVTTIAIDTPEPSPFSHEIVNSNPYAFLDDAPLEERRARAVQLRRTLPADYEAGAGALSSDAIAQVTSEAWPPMRDADELHEALCGLCLLPAAPEYGQFFQELVAANRATTLHVRQAGSPPESTSEEAVRHFWTPAERLELVHRVYPTASIYPAIAAPAAVSRDLPESPERCAAEILRGWFECSGPIRASAISRNLAMPRDLVDQALAQLEAEGQILRGQFTSQRDDEPEWCHRRLLARIHRLTIGKLRREIEPVSTAEFEAFLDRWQHLAPGTQLHGVDGTLQIVKQLQGAEFPAATWEDEVLPRRVARYKPEFLDQLCLSGEVSWGRLSPHPAFERDDTQNGHRRRVRPTRVAPLTLFLREDAHWLLANPQASPRESLSHAAREVLAAIESRGASFFADLTRSTGRLASEVEDALWELVAAGLVTADGFENLRALLDPKRRRGEGKGRSARPRHAPGRWDLLRHTEGTITAHAESFAKQLLSRYGILFRDLAIRESLAPAWRDLLMVLRRMESRGEIRGGRFVEAYLGEQFALPEALDLMRRTRKPQLAEALATSTANT